MNTLHLLIAGIALVSVAACDEIAVANDPSALADVRGQKSCIAAVAKHTGIAGSSINARVPVIELNRFIVDAPNGTRWVCVTDNDGKATEISQRHTG